MIVINRKQLLTTPVHSLYTAISYPLSPPTSIHQRYNYFPVDHSLC